MEIVERVLAGIGTAQDFTTEGGRRVGVVVTRTGERQLVLYDRREPECGGETVRLTPEEAALLATLLAGPP